MQRLTYLIIVGVILIAPVQQAYAGTFDYLFENQKPRWVVIIVGEDCWDGLLIQKVERYLEIETGFEQYLNLEGLEVLCMANAEVKTLDKVTVPLLRENVFPKERILFVYPAGEQADFIALASRNGYRLEAGDGAAGIALIRHGYALVQYMAGGTPHNFAYSMKHEATHIALCLGHDDPFDPVEEWYPIRETKLSPWC